MVGLGSAAAEASARDLATSCDAGERAAAGSQSHFPLGRNTVVLYADRESAEPVEIRLYDDREQRPGASGLEACPRCVSTRQAGAGGSIEASPGPRDASALPETEARAGEPRDIAVDGLASALAESEDPARREALARALGDTWSEAAVPPLADALATDGDASVREAAARAMGRVWSDDAAGPLGQAVMEDPARFVREAAASSLGEVGGLDAAGFLAVALLDPDAGVREAAARALARLGEEARAPEVLEALRHVAKTDRDSWVREAAWASTTPRPRR